MQKFGLILHLIQYSGDSGDTARVAGSPEHPLLAYAINTNRVCAHPNGIILDKNKSTVQ